VSCWLVAPSVQDLYSIASKYELNIDVKFQVSTVFALVAVPPCIDRSSFRPELKLKSGRDFGVEVRFIGIPSPTASWTRLDGAVV